MYESRVVVAFVEVFEYRREDLWFFVREGYSFGSRFHELPAAGGLEEGRDAEDVFVCCEQATLTAYFEGDY